MFERAIGMILLTTLAAAGPRSAAPDFTADDVNGARVRLTDFQDRVVVLNFWATWCGGCKLEIPWLIDFENRYKAQGLTVVGVSMDEDGWKIVKPFATAKGMHYPIVLGNADLTQRYGVDAMPRTLLIDRSGRIAFSHSGVIDRTAFETEIRSLLAEPVRSGTSKRTAPDASGGPGR